jgi:hypothetical protein
MRGLACFLQRRRNDSCPWRKTDARTQVAAMFVLSAVASAFDRTTARVAARAAAAAWDILHVLGTHRWRDGWETNHERGWRQYRGSRCTICDAPWEGW